MATIQEMQSKLDQYQQLLKEIKKDYQSVIIDKNIPLDERWEFFKNAPAELKQHSPYGFHLSAFPSSWNWYSDYDCERHQTVDLFDLVSELEEDVERLADGDDAMFFYTEKVLKNNPNAVSEIKEEMMRLNVSSFTFDW
jgi:hypothetical protein